MAEASETLRHVAVAVLLLSGMALPALAETPMTVDEIRSCLCEEQTLKSMRQQTDQQRQSFNDAHNALTSLNAQIEQTRKTMNPNDELAIQMMVEMIHRRDALNTKLREQTEPALNAAIAKLNAAVADYNQKCTQRLMLKVDIENAQRNLSCPAAQ